MSRLGKALGTVHRKLQFWLANATVVKLSPINADLKNVYSVKKALNMRPLRLTGEPYSF